jgi:hypothetical protein
MPLLHRQGRVAPNIGDVEGADSPGGFVMDSRSGLYDSVLVLDYKSLYPSIIRTFLIDPLGLIEGLREPEDTTVPGYRGGRFSRTRHCLPNIVTQVWAGREAAKKAQNAPLSQALKIIMNAFYGVLGTTVVDHDAWPRHHAPHARADRRAGLPGHLRRHRFDLRLAGQSAYRRRCAPHREHIGQSCERLVENASRR